MNRKLTLTFWVGTLCMVLFPLAVFTQSNVPPCNGADPTGTSCDATCIPCVDGINGYTNTVPPVNNPTAPNPLCNGNNVPNNTQWLAFVAGTTNLTLSIAWGNCTQGNGMQAGIVGGCPDINTTGVVCSGACPGPNPIVLSASGLIPGDDYFIWFDGCAGASCEYTVTVVSGSTIFDQPPGPTVAPFGPLTGCPGGAPVNYQTFPVANATDYIWTVNPGADIVVNGTNATISWPPGVEGTYEVCVQAVNACFQADVECFFVDVAEPTETFLGPNFYCPEDPGYFYPGTNLFYGVGQNEIVFTTAAGCDSTVFLEVEEYFVEPGFIDTAICFGDFALIDGVPYTIPLINTEIPLNNFTTVNGCDSSVVVNLEVVRPIIDGFTVDAQLNCANFDIGTVIFVDSPQFGDPNASWEWSTDDGQVCDGNVNSEILFVCAPGTYVVTLTYTDFNQFASCTMVDSIEIIADFTPPTLAGSSTPANCGDPVGTATVDVTNTTNPEIEWDSNAGGQMTATATDLAPGSYWVTVTGENGCVDSLEVNVVGTPPIDIVEEAIQPANCNGEANGSATISLVDAVGTTTILWTPTGQNGLTATGLAAGTYTVFVTDANGCTAEEMVTITEPTVVEMLSVTPDTQLDCNGDTDATATAAGQGGTGMLNYQWGPGTGNQTGPTATGLGAGTYSVTVTDENGCLDIGSVTITEPTLVEMTSVTAGLLDCNGDLDGTATATGQGGTGMLNYQWGPGTGNQTGPIATGLGAGTYNVTVTDQNGCSDIGSVTITEPTLVEMTSVTAGLLDCNGDLDGTATATGQGGTGMLNYQWGPGTGNQTGPIATGLGAGTYNVTVTDQNGCSDIGSVTITEPTLVEMTSVTAGLLDCNGDLDGTATATGQGGTGMLNYQWGPGTGNQTGPTATGLGAGTYNVTVTDQNGCSDIGSVTITEPTLVEMTSVTAGLLDCNGDLDGTATAAGQGGTGMLNYQWGPGTGNQTGPTATGLGAGTYNVTVTDQNGCSDIGSVTITEPTLVEMTSVTAGLLDCNGDLDGTATATGQGGTGMLNYQWGPGTGNQTGPTATGLGAGTYNVTVTDVNGCSDIGSVTITEPTLVEMTSVTASQLDCNGDQDATASASGQGGTGNLTYQWGPAAGGQVGPTAVGLGAGTYYVTVTDVNGCSDVGEVTITEPTLVEMTSVTADLLDCNGDLDGTATASGQGGTGTLNFQWGPGTGNQTGPMATGLGAGTYYVTVTDMNGCSDVGEVTITDPVLVEMTSVTASLLDCNGDLDGTATATGQGGTGTLDYQWGPGTGNQTGPMATGLGAGTYNVTVTDVNGCSDIGSVTITEPVLLEMISVTATLLDCGGDTDATATANGQGGTGALNYQWGPGTGNQTGPTATGLGAGTYNVSVIDDNGCVDIGSVTITEPTPVQVSPLDQVNVACYGESTGSATVEASGGTAPYDYLWDANAGSQPTATANSLTAGIYNVTATDANGCAQDYTVTITEPAAPLAALTDLVVNATCGESNGSIGISVSGGTGTIYYQWDVNANSQTGPVASSLGAGTYSVTITDDNNCELIYSETVSTPNNFEANVLQVDSVSCFGDSDGNIMINVTGGNDPYTYQWNYVPTPNAEDLMGVPAGPYSLTITDADGCEITLTTNVGQPEPLQGDAITTLASCGLSDGSINLTVTGGTTPYTYAWTGGAMPVQDPTGLPAGNYEVTITDAKLCETIVQTTILVPNGPMLDFTQEDAKCYLSNTGSIEVNITGGTPPFLYDWSNGLPAPPISNPGSLPAGNYEVVVTDINNCSITQSFVITEPAELTADILNIVPATCGDANGSVEIDVNGGTPPYTFLWNGSIMDQNPSGLPAGDYNLVATDANGCTVSALAQVIPPDGLAFQPTDVRPVSCFGDSDGEIQLNVTGGMPPFDYVWDPPQGNIANPSGLTAGIYLATVTDANGCPLETSVTIPEPAALFAQSFPLNASCANNDGSITLQVQGGTMGYSFSWEGPGGFTSSSRDLSGLAMGDYYLTITDANSCPYQLIETISIPDAPTAISSIVDVDCFGNSTGRIAVVAAGGAGSYTYNWSGGIAGNEPIATGVTQGVYSVTITDAQSCSFVLDDLTVNEPPVLDLTGSTTQATCNQSNGSVTAVVDGGTMPYRYDWSPTLPNSPNQPGLGVGTYTLTVTDANDCTIVESFVVGSPENLGASTTHIDVTCNGGSDGSISLTASGGTPPFTFQWDNGAGAVQNPGGLTANTYNVVVTDANGCTIVASATITEPPLIEVSTVGTIDATCGLANGSIDVDVIGGTGGYQYVWTNSSGTTVSNSEDPTGLSAGTYLATVTDASGCTMTFTESVTTPNMLLVSTTADPTSCFGGDDGIVQVMVTGGIPPFDYTWQDPQYMGDRLEGVPAGTYFVTVTDADDCTFTEQAVVEEPPQLLAVSEVPLGISCNGESDAAAIIAATGGTPPYQYDWREDALDGQQAPENLASGEYQVTVIDSKGCQFTETFNISDPPELVSSITGAPANCFGAADGGIEVLASGGTGDYVYVWTSDLDSIANPTGVAAGTYSVSVYDANNCLTTESFEVTQPTEVLLEVESVSDYAGFNVSCAESTDGSVTVTATGGTGPYDFTWEDGREGATVGDLSPGVFLVTVTDANDCPFEDQVSLTSPEPVVTEPDFIPIQCHGDANGMIFVDQVGGGAAPYRYSIDGSVFGSGVFPGLTAGEYIVETMDANGCMDRDTIMITEPDPINIDLGGDQEIAWGDSTTIEPEITGIPLTAVDTFFWLSPGEFECWSDDCLDLLVRPLISTPYTIRIRDENNCVTEDQVMVRVKKERLVYIPTGFAPDATDPNNQSFTIFAGQGVEEIESLFIFDRWGEILYENTNFAPNNPDLGWDGTLQGEDMQPAVFVYIAKIRFSDGSVELFTGDVTLMR